MHFPRYWTTVRKGNVNAWGWSDSSLADAEGKAQERLLRMLDRLRRGQKERAERYSYPGRPLREEVLQEFRGADGMLEGAVSRNSFGCLVLNTSQLMFVDVDSPESRESSYLEGLFGFLKPKKGRRPEEFVEGVLARVNEWVTRRPDWGWRVYKTHSGMRLLATQQPIGPGDAMCKEAFEAFGSDPLYRQLCASQKCFRARLTPKPWRCDMEKPRGRWPWANEKTEAAFRKWEQGYIEAARDYAVCKLMGHFGNQDVSPGHMELIALHDRMTRIDSDLRLA